MKWLRILHFPNCKSYLVKSQPLLFVLTRTAMSYVQTTVVLTLKELQLGALNGGSDSMWWCKIAQLLIFTGTVLTNSIIILESGLTLRLLGKLIMFLTIILNLMTKGALCVIYKPIIIDSSALIYYKVNFSLMYLGIFPVGNAGRDFPLLLFFHSYLKELQRNNYLSIFNVFSDQLLQIPLVFVFIHVLLQNSSYAMDLTIKFNATINPCNTFIW